MHTHPSLLASLLLCAAVSFGSFACEKEKVQVKSQRSTKTVELPPKPPLEPPKYTKQHADGVWTVEGLLRNNKKAMGNTVKVRGSIVKLVKCPPPAPHTEEEIAKFKALHDKWKKLVKLGKRINKIPPDEPILKPKKQARTCNPRPQAVLQDTPPSDRFKLTVAGSMYSPLAVFTNGQVVTIEGVFDMVTPDGHYMNQDGLMHLKDVPQEDDDKVQEAPGEAAPAAGKKAKK